MENKKPISNRYLLLAIVVLTAFYIYQKDVIGKVTAYLSSAADERTSTVTENHLSVSSEEASADDILTQIQNHTFNLNGGVGEVVFSPSLTGPEEGTINISGASMMMSGEYRVTGNRSIRIRDLIVVSGSFDASNNRGSSGTATLTDNGTLTLSVRSGGDYRTYTCYPN